jgi:hypothetical protein
MGNGFTSSKEIYFFGPNWVYVDGVKIEGAAGKSGD